MNLIDQIHLLYENLKPCKKKKTLQFLNDHSPLGFGVCEMGH